MIKKHTAARLWAPGRIAVKGFLLIPFLLATVSAAQAQNRFIPKDSAVLLQSAATGQASIDRDTLRAAIEDWRANPNDIETATTAARLSFLAAMNQGDPRWLGNAKAMLNPWWGRQDLPAQSLFVRALVRQGLHEFDAALADLDLAIARDSAQTEFWAWRFAIYMVKADINKAKQECQAIGTRFGASEQASCRAVLLYRTGSPQQAITQLDNLTRHPDYQGRFAKEWLAYHRGEVRRVAGDQAGAEKIWADYLQGNSRSHVLQLALVELLNEQQKFAAAWKHNTTTPRSDALLVQAIKTSQGLQNGQADQLRKEFNDRLTQQTSRGDFVNERPVIDYFLNVVGDYSQALAMAQQSWKTQREPADAFLFAKAAIASGAPTKAAELLKWQAETGYEEPRLDQLLASIRAALPTKPPQPPPAKASK
jgi:tetratricopeptide (TPR) repeat protein